MVSRGTVYFRLLRRAPGRFVLTLLLSLLDGASAVCASDLVVITFDLNNVAHSNFAGQGPDSGDQNIRMTNAGVHDGRSIDVVLDSPDGAPSVCSDTSLFSAQLCDFAVRNDGIGQFKVSKNIGYAVLVRWSFEWTDSPGTSATLPKVAITWLDMGSQEFVAIETGVYDEYWMGSRLSATENWYSSAAGPSSAWATLFSATNGGGTLADVTDPFAMTADQQTGALQVFRCLRHRTGTPRPLALLSRVAAPVRHA